MAAGAAGLVAVRANLAARDAKNQEAAAARVRATVSKPKNIPAAAIIGGTVLAGALYFGVGAWTPAASPVPPTPKPEPTIVVVGNELKKRAAPDGASNIQFVDKDLAFTKPGRIVGWDFFVGRAGVQRLQVRLC